MGFFEHQERARLRTRVLVVLFALAVVAVVALVDALALGLLALLGGRYGPLGGHAADVHLGVVAWTSTLTLALIVAAAWWRSAGLRAGGGQVAQELGGTALDPSPADPGQRRLGNLVEEMALAAGVAVPEVYILEDEPGINALAAGYSPADAAIAVTRGALDKLDRDQLQGVVAHELSHIVNGDTRIDIRLMGALYGILAVSLLGRHLTGSGGNPGRSSFLVLLGWALRLIGAVGLLAARLVKAALARQREYLADACAVQYTRNPDGIAGALRRIAVEPGGGLLIAEAEEVSHMTFGPGTQTRLLSSHPPLTERIRRLDPRFHPAQLQALARRLGLGRPGPDAAVTQHQASPQADLAAPLPFPGFPDTPDGSALLAAALLVESLPAGLSAAARSPEWAAPLLCRLLLAGDPDLSEAQRLLVARGLGAEAEGRLAHLLAEHPAPAPQQRLPLAELAFPALRRLPRADLARLERTVIALIRADRQVEVFEYALALMLRVQLGDALEPSRVPRPGRLELADLETQGRDLILALAHLGHGDGSQARAAADAGLARAGWAPAPPGPRLREDWREVFERVLPPLTGLRPQAKGTLVAALAVTVAWDRQVQVAEAESLRAICAVLRVPLPLAAASLGA